MRENGAGGVAPRRPSLSQTAGGVISHLSKLKILVPAGLITLLVFFFAPAAGAEDNLGKMVLDSKIEAMQKLGVKPVVFPHTLHEEIAKCSKCHPSIFVPKRGANDISMLAIMKGKSCGTTDCHHPSKPKAFPLSSCVSCHTEESK